MDPFGRAPLPRDERELSATCPKVGETYSAVSGKRNGSLAVPRDVGKKPAAASKIGLTLTAVRDAASHRIGRASRLLFARTVDHTGAITARCAWSRAAVDCTDIATEASHSANGPRPTALARASRGPAVIIAAPRPHQADCAAVIFSKTMRVHSWVDAAPPARRAMTLALPSASCVARCAFVAARDMLRTAVFAVAR